MKLSRPVRRIHDVFGLSAENKEQMSRVTSIFPFQATEYYLSLIDWDDPDDPIKKIILPDEAELEELTAGDMDPCNEAANLVAPGVQHKYPHTALLVCIDECAALCRYCFRKRLFSDIVSKDEDDVGRDIEPGLDYIRNNPRVNNVLLTGGDPLMMPTSRLAYILEELRDISHVNVIRIGSKTPAYNPDRILNDPELIRAIKRVSTNERRVYIMAHFDHPREITDKSAAAVAEFINNGIHVCNQNPILAGINDDPDTLIEHYRALTSMGVVTYYLFIVRPTAGNDSFQVPIARAYEVLAEARRHLSGLEKRVRLVMSHASGKIEILAVDDDYIYMKYHRARNPEDENRVMIFYRDDDALWLEDLVPVRFAAG